MDAFAFSYPAFVIQIFVVMKISSLGMPLRLIAAPRSEERRVGKECGG